MTNVPQPGVGQRGVDVLHGGEDAVGVPAGDLVAHGDVLQVDPRERLHIALHLRGRRARVGGQRGEVRVGHVHDHPDVAAAQRVESVGVREVDAHLVDAVGLVELHHVARRRQVVAVHAVAHADGVDSCTSVSIMHAYRHIAMISIRVRAPGASINVWPRLGDRSWRRPNYCRLGHCSISFVFDNNCSIVD